MTEQPSEKGPETVPESEDAQKLTAFGEPLWVDVLKTVGVGMAMLLGTIVIGGILGVMIIAPWGRASHDCSIYCVLEQQFDSYFSDKPS
ncbi:MAG: hypothetical protein GKS00_25315 [Alphaproteobacteria bacterium]|nr:hypothetical protein [Alphaproteobacteria bacterium]